MSASLIAPMASPLLRLGASSLINVINGKGEEGIFLPLLALPLMMKVLGIGVRRAVRRYNIFSAAASFKKYRDY